MAKETRDGDSHHFTAISLADLIQVGGVILGILIGLVSATTDRARFVMTLIICATVLLCGAFYLLFVKRAEWRSRRVVLQVLLSVIMVAVAATYSNSPRTGIREREFRRRCRGRRHSGVGAVHTEARVCASAVI